MTRVDFYLLGQQTAAGVYPFACRLLEKIHKSSQVFVALNTMNECETFNKLLWTFHDISFIPHCLITDAIASETPIHLGTVVQLNNHSIVINLSDETLTNLNNLERIIEIVPNEPDLRQASRKKYLAYKNQQCELHTHKML